MLFKEILAKIREQQADDNFVNKVQRLYGRFLPSAVYDVLALSKADPVFYDDNDVFRMLSQEEILKSNEELGVDFLSLKAIPLFDIGDNDFIVYHKDSWRFFNIEDEDFFGESFEKLAELLEKKFAEDEDDEKRGMISNESFGDMIFDSGWKASDKFKISLWGKDFEVNVKAKSYREEDAVTKEQEEAFLKLKKELSTKQANIEKLLIEFYEDDYEDELDDGALLDEVTPTSLIINRKGECALMLDQESDPDSGLAVILYPNEDIMTQDEYL